MPSRSSPTPVTLLVALALAGCAHRTTIVAAPAAPAPPPEQPTLSPALAAIVPPPANGEGGYRTINTGLDENGAVWHLRAALNVAAIGCRGPGDAGTVAAYNAMLATEKATLLRANAGVRDRVHAGGGDADAYMTKLYNYFAMPVAKPGFCAAAAEIAPEAAATTPAAFPAYARTALARLEAPFVAVYREVDAYRTASAAWNARYGAAATQIATAEPPVAESSGDMGLPRGADGMAGHYDLPRASSSRRAAGVPASRAAPRLAYADLGEVVAWQPGRRAAYAAR